tara:strand:- start:9011 stop:9223 length:213 start_codon:yes stop_codon:yes gene_type:complete
MSWSDERRRRQAEMIRRWKPWERSTGPRTCSGKKRSSKNAYKGGVRPQLRRLRSLLAEMEKELRSAFNHD